MNKRSLTLIYLLALLLILFGIAGGTVYANDTSASSMPDDLAPYITGQLGKAPVLPGFYWSTLSGATWYRLYLQSDDGTIVYDEWFEALAFCAETYCELLDNYTFIEEWGLVNADYELWIAAYIENTGQIIWSGGANYEPVSFTVDVPPPNPPALLATWLLFEPYIQIYLDPNTSWFQLYVGGHGEQYLEWHSVNDPACQIDELQITCIFVQETHLPLYWGSGTYAVWMQGWGPGGFSSPNGTNSIESWVEDVYDGDPGLVFPDTPPVAPVDLYASNISQDIYVQWDYSQGGSWYELIIENEGNNWSHSQWYHSSEVNCGNALEIPICFITIEDVPYENSPYVLKVSAWGPGGFSIGGPNGDGYAITTLVHNGTGVE